MCTLAAFVGAFPVHPLVEAANRDEFLSRPAAPPGLLRPGPPRAFGGRDLVAGGTWLGVTETGLVAGLLNRRSAAPPDPTRRSRGQLCLDVLACATAAEAAARVAGEPAGRYNPFNLLLADTREAFVASQGAGERPRLLRLEIGLHLLTNLDVNDPRCPRIAAAQRAFAALGESFAREGDPGIFVARLGAVLADHTLALDPRGPGNLCVHADGYGTRSASVLLVGPGGKPLLYFHADGPPCRTPLWPVALPF